MAEKFETPEQAEAFDEGIKEFDNVSSAASDISKQIVTQLTDKIIKENNGETFNLTTSILAASKSLAGLASYLYDSEEEFIRDLQLAREAATDIIIPALLQQVPCGECEECRNGNPDGCINPNAREYLTTSRFLPILCAMIIEYDYFNKIVYTHISAASEQEDQDVVVATENS